jgi:hypothetical protein
MDSFVKMAHGGPKGWCRKVRVDIPLVNRKLKRLRAGIAQLVEHNLAKVGVASSSLVSRSRIKQLGLSSDSLFSLCRVLCHGPPQHHRTVPGEFPPPLPIAVSALARSSAP